MRLYIRLIKSTRICDHIKMTRRRYAQAFGVVPFYIWVFTVFGNGVGFANNYITTRF